MRILLDESLPRGLKRLLEGVEVVTVPEQGWQSMKNGELLRLASGAFDVFVTADQSLEHQQNIAGLPLAVVVLVASTNRLEAYVPLAKKLGDSPNAPCLGHRDGNRCGFLYSLRPVSQAVRKRGLRRRVPG